jgi:hypothetical protein
MMWATIYRWVKRLFWSQERRFLEQKLLEDLGDISEYFDDD